VAGPLWKGGESEGLQGGTTCEGEGMRVYDSVEKSVARKKGENLL